MLDFHLDKRAMLTGNRKMHSVVLYLLARIARQEGQGRDSVRALGSQVEGDAGPGTLRNSSSVELRWSRMASSQPPPPHAGKPRAESWLAMKPLCRTWPSRMGGVSALTTAADRGGQPSRN